MLFTVNIHILELSTLIAVITQTRKQLYQHAHHADSYPNPKL